MYSGEAKLTSHVDDDTSSSSSKHILESVEISDSDHIPHEVLLDRYIRNELRRLRGFESYLGKQNLLALEEAFGSLLLNIQGTLNEGLRGLPVPNVNTSDGITQVPFHIDYVDAGIANAHAFQREGCAFIVLTMPLVEMMWRACERLSRSAAIVQLLSGEVTKTRLEAVYGTLFATQLSYLVAHEYTHHLHRHTSQNEAGLGLWNEDFESSSNGGLDRQAEEIDADAYAAYIVLMHLIIGERRAKALDVLGNQNMTEIAADERLLASFVVAVGAFFCSRSLSKLDATSVYQLTHPPQALRMSYVMDAAKSWSRQNKPSLETRITPDWYQSLMRIVAQAIWESAGEQEWDEQITFLLSADGVEYGKQLSDRFDRLLQNLPG